MGADIDYSHHAAILGGVVEAAQLLLDRLSAVPARSSIRSSEREELPSHTPLSSIYELEDTLQVLWPTIAEARNRVLAPINRLHDDLLRMIFFYANDFQPALPNFHYVSPPKKRQQAGVHSQICRRWRTVALEFAPLWSTLSLAPNPERIMSLSKRMLLDPWQSRQELPWLFQEDEYHAVLQRVKNAPMHLYFTPTTGTTAADLEVNAPYGPIHEFQKLVAKGAHINRLDICLGPSDEGPFLRMVDLFHRLQPTLVSLVMDNNSGMYNIGGPPSSVSLHKLFEGDWPNLCRLEIKTLRLPQSLSTNLSMPQLRVLRIAQPMSDDAQLCGVLALLQLCSRTLETFYYYSGYHHGSSDVPFATIISMSTLKSLEIRGPLSKATPFLSYLSAPSLASLNIVNSSPPMVHGQTVPEGAQMDVAQFLQRSKCDLHAISCVNVVEKAWNLVLDIIPNVRSIHAMVIADDGSRVNCFPEVLPSGSPWLPQLEELICENMVRVQHASQLLALLKSRLGRNDDGATANPIRRIALLPQYLGPSELALVQDERPAVVVIQKEIAELVEEFVVGRLRWNKYLKQWLPFSGSRDWLYKWPADAV